MSFALLACAQSGGRSGPSTDAGKREAAVTQVQLGVGYLEKNRLEDALMRFNRALEFDPRSADAYTGLGVLHEKIDRPDLAEQHYRKAAELAPKRGAVRNNLGQFLCRHGKFEESSGEFTAALDDPFYSTPEVAAVNAGKCAKLAGQTDRAERFLRLALERKPQLQEALLPLAEIAFERGEFLRARAFIQRHEAAQLPETAEFLALAIAVEQKLGDQRSIESYQQRLIERFPKSEQAQELLKRTTN
jgi:type IV pilus assembly protein PilF